MYVMGNYVRGKLERGRGLRSVESECFQKRSECGARRRDPGSAGGRRRKRVRLRSDCNARRRDPGSAGGRRRKRVRLRRDCNARRRDPGNRGGGKNGRGCLHRDRGTRKCHTGSGLDSGWGRVRSGRRIGFRALPRSLSSGVWVIVNTTALALNNADTPCCKPTCNTPSWVLS